ncbi:hypothetical protein Poly51_06950 [Rubripirellula tenax]|uniref:protein-tyrosine-phosphatase n=1 Tax=Rubripirellula tenax TaxID=2528015 RepID=A0A5C6FK30_9BACT|nr:CpsB/CapC family capsule biosynthesis tyrosine phosphatase [Rubripirellula tenax]TWU60419.1 hypothetical protein Poly51_06950 [Rubripirellula tenax]
MGLFWNHDVAVCEMADINSGIFRCSADGNVHWPKSLRFAELAAEDGIRRAVAVTNFGTMDTVVRRLGLFNALLIRHRVELEVKAAVEFSLGSDLFNQIVRAATVMGGLNRHYVMLRIHPGTSLPIASVVETIRKMHLRTILVAPERCDALVHRPTEWKRLASAGALIQFSAKSLLDESNPRRIRFCRSMIREGRCHFIGTELGRDDGTSVSLAEAFRVIARWADIETATNLCWGNTNCVWENQPVQVSDRFNRSAGRQWFRRPTKLAA